MSYRLQPGYCYQWDGDEKTLPRTQNWDTTVFIEGEYPTVEYRGTRTIDGALCAIFFVGIYRNYHRYLAQTCVSCQIPPRLRTGDHVVF